MMEIHEFDWHDIPNLPGCVYACGFFDGLHKGHQQLFEQARQLAAKLRCQWGILTFHPDPWTVFKPDANLDHITSIEDREKLAEQTGCQQFCILRFTKDFASRKPEEFHDILKSMHAKGLVTGFDFHYGSRNAGNVETLKICGLPVVVVDEVQDHEQKISSTRIESCIRKGNVDEAATLLGRLYSIPGHVVHGYKRGSSLLDFPTANLKPVPGYIMPAAGVYAGYVEMEGKRYPAMINVGTNPTFDNKKQTLEANLLDFSGNLYGRGVRFEFVCRLRDERKFANAEALKAQLQKDRDHAWRELMAKRDKES